MDRTEVGRRNWARFMLAALLKGNMPLQYAERYVTHFMRHYNPPCPENDIRTEFLAIRDEAYSIAVTSTPSITERVRKFVEVTTGNFTINNLYNTIVTSVTSEDKAKEKNKIRVVLSRMCTSGEIEAVSKRGDGVYRRVDRDCLECDWKNAVGQDSKIWLPLGLDQIAIIPFGSMVLFSGEPNAGKSAMCMMTARENMERFTVNYFSSEMGPGMFKRRAAKFPDLTVDQWKVRFYELAGRHPADVIKKGSENLNIIDYVEFGSEAKDVADIFEAIYNNLGESIAIVALQKPIGRDLGYGGSFTLQKPNLAVSISPNKAKIMKLKEWPEGTENPNGKVYKFKLIDGCRTVQKQSWHREDSNAV